MQRTGAGGGTQSGGAGGVVKGRRTRRERPADAQVCHMNGGPESLNSAYGPLPLIVPDPQEELSRHHPAAFGWALACCRWDRSEAEDVLQIAYLKVLDGRARFNGRSDFRTFLFGVIRHTAREERRRRGVRAWLPLAVLGGERDAPQVAHTGERDVIRDESSRRLIAALMRLPGRQRDVLHLVFYQELSIAEAARVLGVSLGTARTHYERGKAQLRRVLEER